MLPTLSDDPSHSFLLAEAFLQRLANRYSDLQVDQDQDMPHRTIVPNNFSSHELTMNFSSHELTMASSSINLDSTLRDPNNSCLHQLAVTNGESSSNNGGQNSVSMLEREPLHIERAVKQYMFDKNGVEYLDCVNGTAHVGHSHPQVVGAGQSQMAKLVTAQGFVSDLLKKYVKQLVETLPEPLSVCYLTNSGSEANDLALRLATSYTGHDDVVVVEDGYHGNLGILVDISEKMHKKIPNYKKKDYVHIAKLPDMFRGKYKYEDEEAGLKYAQEVEKVILAAEAKGRKIAAFICEPMLVIPGVYPTQPSYFKHVYRIVREHGGLVIADEVQSGLGRTGSHMWGFQHFDVVPDIVATGKPLGNGHPMGAVICSREVSEKLGGYFSTFGGNPVSCAIGLSVFEIVKNEKLVSSAKMVGKHLHKALEEIKQRHPCVGDVRGAGLLLGIEIVNNKEDRIPEDRLASEIMYRLKQKQVLVGITGRDRNVLLFTPPMCFTIANSTRFVKCLDEVLIENKKQIPFNPRVRSVIVPRKRANVELSDLVKDSKKAKISEVVEMEEDDYGDMD